MKIAGAGLLKVVRFAVSEYRKVFSLSLLLILISGAAEGISIAFLAIIADFLQHGEQAEIRMTATFFELLRRVHLPVTLLTIVTLLCATIILKAAFVFAQEAYVNRFLMRLDADTKNQLFSGVMASKYAYFVQQKTATLTNLLAVEVRFFGDIVVALTRILAGGCVAAIYVGMALWIEWRLFVLSWVAVLVVYASFARLVRKSKKLGHQVVMLNNDIQDYINECWFGFKYLKTTGIESHFQDRFSTSIGRRAETEHRAFCVKQFVKNSVEPLGVLMIAMNLLAGIHIFGIGLTELLIMVVVSGRMSKRLVMTFYDITLFYKCLPSFEAVRREIDAVSGKKEVSGAVPFRSLGEGLSVRDVSFFYESGEPILDHVSLSIPKGAHVAFIGRSGQGKTTLLDLLTGLLDPISGSIDVGGVCLKDLDLRSYRSRIGFVPQDPFLVHGSILDNVRMNRPEATMADVERVCRLTHAAEFVETFAQGYETVVGDRGVRLSGGQKQRLILARALLIAPELLILDEATSSLDDTSERLVRETLRELKGKLTMVTIAHRLTTIADADIIYLVEGGHVRPVTYEEGCAYYRAEHTR